MSADLIARLITAGTPAELVAEVAMALAQAQAEARAQIEAALSPSKGALRTRRWRERQSSSQNVTCDAGDAQVTESVTDPSPASPSPKPPRTPQEPLPLHPHPDGFDAHTRGLAIRLVMAVIAAGARSAKWNGMPPPARVSDEQWRGFLEHRRHHRKGGKFTQRAYVILSNKLEGLADAGWPPGDLIDTAIERGWITVFPPKSSTANGSAATRTFDRPSAWRGGALSLVEEPISLDD